MKSVLILQNEVMEYRKPVYNGLAELYKVVILHTGKPSVLVDDRYKEIITPDVQIGRFHFQPRTPLTKIIGDFDVVISMFDLAWPAYMLPLYWRNRPKTILWGHRYSANKLACIIRDRMMQHADRLLMYGDEEVDKMIQRGVDPAKIRIAWNTIHVPNHNDYSDAEKNSLLFVGRLQPLKRIDLIIHEFSSIHTSIPCDTVLDIVGSPASNAPNMDIELKRLANSLGIGHKVFFHGRVDDPARLAELFSRAYAYVSPSPVGLGVLHSLAYGVPVITLQNERHGPEYLNLVHMRNALLCKDLTEFTDAMRTVCNENNLSSELGHAAYQHYVTNRSLSTMLNGFIKAIEE